MTVVHDRLVHPSLDDAGILTVVGVSRSFGGIRAVQDVTFGVPRGSTTGLIGPNGAGKTTLVNLITGHIPPDAGSISLEGRSLTGLATHQVVDRGITRTFQNVRLAPTRTVFLNVLDGTYRLGSHGLRHTLAFTRGLCAEEAALRDAAIDALETMGLLDLRHTPASQLSTGQQRLTEVARAIAGQPTVVLLDEPAAGLNGSETERLGAALGQVRRRGTTILVIEHDVDFVFRLADHIVVLDHGEHVASGPPAKVRVDDAVIQAYLGTGGS